MSEHAHRAATGPGGEKLLAAHLLLAGMHEIVSVDEALVARAMDPLWATGSLETHQEWEAGLYAMLRTAAYYILDADDSREAVASMPPALPSFPPLPFRRIWIEAAKFKHGIQTPASYAKWSNADPTRFDGLVEHMEILGIAISEVVRGREWQIFLPHRLSYDFEGAKASEAVEAARAREGVRVMAFHITPNNIISPAKMVKGEAWHVGHLLPLLQLAINGAHLITARGVPHREFVLPRAQRKRLGREAYAPSPPKLYYVDLAGAGEGDDEAPSGREYHCRWLVSGHWRHLDHGQELCTCYEHRHSPRPATWIEPYVKGPVSAPWKGRPVHRSVR